MKYVCIGAHSDDPDLYMGATAMKLIAMGHEVKFIAMCNGDAGHQSMTREARAKRRYGESRASAKLIGLSEYEVFDTHDCNAGSMRSDFIMRHNHSPRIRFFLLALAFFAAASAAPAAPPESLVLENAALRAEVVPAWAGRLLFLGRPKGTNLLWTAPGAADVPEYVDGRRQWRNFGGEKTWVGTQEEVWPLFATTNRDGTVWPPPAWFDVMPLSVVRADATNILLRSGFHGCRNGSWTCAIEREFTLFADRLEIRQRLLLPEGAAGAGETPKPDDPRRIWSVTQVPRPDRVALHLCGGRRTVRNGGIPEPTPSGDAGWSELDVASVSASGKLEADGDALAVRLSDGTGWLVIRQSAAPRHLAAFNRPGRAMIYVSPKDWRPSPYVELEFAAYGPDAAHTLDFRILDSTPAK